MIYIFRFLLYLVWFIFFMRIPSINISVLSIRYKVYDLFIGPFLTSYHERIFVYWSLIFSIIKYLLWNVFRLRWFSFLWSRSIVCTLYLQNWTKIKSTVNISNFTLFVWQLFHHLPLLIFYHLLNLKIELIIAICRLRNDFLSLNKIKYIWGSISLHFTWCVLEYIIIFECTNFINALSCKSVNVLLPGLRSAFEFSFT